MGFTFLISKHCGRRSYADEPTNWHVWSFSGLLFIIARWLLLFSKNHNQVLGRKKDVMGSKYPPLREAKLFPKAPSRLPGCNWVTRLHLQGWLGSQAFCSSRLSSWVRLGRGGWEWGPTEPINGACHRRDALIGQTWFTSSFVKLEWTLLPQD